jgi:hypothetical protein
MAAVPFFAPVWTGCAMVAACWDDATFCAGGGDDDVPETEQPEWADVLGLSANWELGKFELYKGDRGVASVLRGCAMAAACWERR